MKEFQDIPGFEGLYQVCKNGDVYSLLTKKILRKRNCGSGYIGYSLRRDGNTYGMKAHRLVLLTFVGDSEMEVNHINGNKHDNRLENIEYCTRSENNRHAIETGLRIMPYGDNAYRRTLSLKTVLDIKKAIAKGDKRFRAIAKDFGVASGTISKINTGKLWGRAVGESG